MQEEIIITRADFVTSAVKVEQYPGEDLPQIAFWGRSNVGKSSLINSLTNRRKLAKVSGSPGKTRTINFFSLTAKHKPTQMRRDFCLVDLPGYGYAKTSKTDREQWAKFIDEYFRLSSRILFVCLLIDLRHPPMANDVETFRRLVNYGLAVLPIGTKADKAGKSLNTLSEFKKAVGIDEVEVLPYSAVTGIGRDELLNAIWQELEG